MRHARAVGGGVGGAGELCHSGLGCALASSLMDGKHSARVCAACLLNQS